jgi:3-deoxy-manno-octulosonate cytidylyltransferase (CMP-KDO synthetase)
MKTIIIIPARWESTRLPGKPLAMIGDKPMIQHTWERACKSEADEVVIATDDMRIFKAATEFGAQAVMTPACETGTERVIGVQNLKNADYVINVQGDEPFINHEDINTVIGIIKRYNVIGTLVADLEENERTDRNVVKALVNEIGQVGMFTRSAVYSKHKNIHKHIGIYGYPNNILNKISIMAPSEGSVKDSLEQLTWLDNKISIKAYSALYKSLGIDTLADLKKANDFYKTIS